MPLSTKVYDHCGTTAHALKELLAKHDEQERQRAQAAKRPPFFRLSISFTTGFKLTPGAHP
jgi:hypothetical protein